MSAAQMALPLQISGASTVPNLSTYRTRYRSTQKVNLMTDSLTLHFSKFVNQNTQALPKAKIKEIAQSITVVIWDAQNSLSGSGVIVRRDGDHGRKTYTVLTARHAVEDNQNIRVITPDGECYSVDPVCIRILADVDLALLQFESDHASYSLAKLGDCARSDVNTPSFTAGFPSTEVTGLDREINITSGKIVFKAEHSLGSGYAVVCSNTSLPGMSGGPALNTGGELIGIIGASKGGTVPFKAWSYAVPINTFLNLVPNFKATSFRLANIPDIKGCDYLLRGNAKFRQGDTEGAIGDYSEDIRIHPYHALSFHNRGGLRRQLGDIQGAIEDYNQAIKINPKDASALNDRGGLRYQMEDKQGAIEDFSEAIILNPQSTHSYSNRGIARLDLGDIQGAIEDCTQAIDLNPDCNTYTARGNAYSEMGDKQRAIEDYKRAATLAQQQNDQSLYDQLQAVIEHLKSA